MSAHSAILFTLVSRRYLTQPVRLTNSTDVLVISNSLICSAELFKKDASERLFLCPLSLLRSIMPWKIGRFCLASCILWLFCIHQLYAEPVCSTEHFDETTKIRYIHDGDTLHLIDGRKVRLIGINTPELAHDNKPAEAYAKAARSALRSLFSKEKSISLLYGEDKRDRYGRLLAHIFLADGRNVQAILLKQGLANSINVPPNTRFSSCYLEMERMARCNGAGFWENSILLDAKNLKKQHTGFHLVRGKINSVTTNSKGIWLNLDNKLTIGIRPDDQSYFDEALLNEMVNQTVIVRGWINQSNRSTPFYLRLRHPDSMQLAATFACSGSSVGRSMGKLPGN